MLFFKWLRSKVRAAVLAGIGDAAAELDPGDGPEVAAAVSQLEARMRPGLPAPDREGVQTFAPVPEPVNGQAVRGRNKRGAP
jgi:hypothetical protein